MSGPFRAGLAEAVSANGYDLAPGARNAIRTCLRVAPEEHVAIITDRETERVAESLAAEIRDVGAPYELHVLEDYGDRPMLDLPQPVRDALERSDVSIYAGQPREGELASRREMTAIVNRREMRHAHMVSITPRIMAEGMRADFDVVDAISTRVRDRAAKAQRIRARSRAGSDLEATFDPSVLWLKTSGLITAAKWANLPGGEVLTAPARVDGVYVVDGVLGDYLCARYGDLEETPLTVWIENSRVADAQCVRTDVRDDFLAYTRTEENSDRVGEFAMGTNVAVHSIIGNILQDEKLPGLHLAFGHTYAEHTGASWSCRTHLDIVGRHFDVWFDDEQVMADGKFLIYPSSPSPLRGEGRVRGSVATRIMIPDLRRAFNESFTEEKYAGYKKSLEVECGSRIEFRLCETPVFLPPELRDKMVRAATEIWTELSRPEILRASQDAVPPALDVPGSGDQPTFAQADFAVTRDSTGVLTPRLIELQAFASLYAFQLFQSRGLQRITPGGDDFDFYLSGLDEDSYVRTVGEAILGGFPAENVVLMDIDPPTQKTYVDFACTEKLWGVRPVSATDIEKRGRELWYRRDGKPTRILRIYNRLIFDELSAKGITLPIDFTQPLDVSWAGHPNWYFRWSKHSLPSLSHPAAPEARLLSDFDGPPSDLDDWVLKPLFSFAGSGVKVDVTRRDFEAVPEADRAHTVLMRKVEYAPVLETVDGNRSKVEVRVMFVWRDGKPLPVTTLARLSQGRMMGVAFNKDRTWVGSSGCLWPRA